MRFAKSKLHRPDVGVLACNHFKALSAMKHCKLAYKRKFTPSVLHDNIAKKKALNIFKTEKCV